jgi:hypothetical protein
MNSVDTNALLNRLLVVHNRSLPMYLGYAVPWGGRGNEAAGEALSLVVADHKKMVDRLGEMILDNGGSVSSGEFPLRFTALHDLSFEYLLEKLIEHQKIAVDEIAECTDQLRLAPSAQAIAQEALGEAKGHLASFEELAEETAASGS